MVVKTEKWSDEQIQAATEKVTERMKGKLGDLLATAVEIQCELTEMLDRQETSSEAAPSAHELPLRWPLAHLLPGGY
jgi:hypothetical protein